VEFLAKTVALEWSSFMRGEVVPLKGPTNLISKLSISSYFMFLPTHALAATENGSWNKLFDKLLELADYADGGIIIFSGATMMFGNRTKAIELLFASSIGYLIIRHWQDINAFLKSI
jgi:hypothetical protein